MLKEYHERMTEEAPPLSFAKRVILTIIVTLLAAFLHQSVSQETPKRGTAQPSTTISQSQPE